MNVITTLLSVTVGALLGFMFNHVTEKRRWKREMEKELKRDKRKAISQTLSWLDPIKNALTIVGSISIAFVRGSISHEELEQRWPPLLSQLSGMDVRPDLRLLLPEGIYAKCLEITMRIDELKPFAVKTGQSRQHSSKEVQKRGRASFEIMSDELHNVQTMLDKFERLLSDEYKDTYKS